jgi:Tol biopolymer transport system component
MHDTLSRITSCTKRRDTQKDVLARESSRNCRKERDTRDVELRAILLVIAFCATLNLGIVLVAVPIQPVRAAFPGENGEIAFASRRDGNLEIYVMNPDGKAQTRLTYDTNLTYSTNFDDYPTWSPDGSKIAFDRYIDDQYQIYVMNANGTGERPLTSGKDPSPFSPRYFALHPSWSPDGSRIAFASDRAPPSYTRQIYIMNAADGSGVTQLTYNANVNDYPAWSPDGSKIAFESNGYLNNYQIYCMNADGLNQRPLTNNTSTNEMPAWSPDGSKILFLSNRYQNDRIFVMNADGSHQTFLSGPGSAQDERPSWSPDGSKILFARGGGALKSQKDICFMNPDGSAPTCLTLSAPDNLDPDWQPIVGHPQLTASVTAITTTVSVSVPAVTVTSTATVLNTETITSPLIGYLGWVLAITLVIFAVGLLMRRRLSLTGRHPQAEKYLGLLAKLDKMHANGEISEAYYLKLKREYEEKLGS